MATLNAFIQTIADELGVEADEVEVEFNSKGDKLIITVKGVDEDDTFDEDFGQDDEGEDDNDSPTAPATE